MRVVAAAVEAELFSTGEDLLVVGVHGVIELSGLSDGSGIFGRE